MKTPLLLIVLAAAGAAAAVSEEQAREYATAIGARLGEFACNASRVGGPRCGGLRGLHEVVEAYGNDTEEAMVSGSALADRLETQMSAYFGARLQYLLRLRDAVQEAYEQETPEDSANINSEFRMGFGTRDALLPEPLAFVDEFLQNVSDPAEGSSAYRVPASADPEPSRPPHDSFREELRRDVGVSRKIDPVFRANYRESAEGDSPIRWQYFGSVNGMFRQHPAVESGRGAAGYADYDPRLRSWYTSSASGPKDVVILIDKSGSMLEQQRNTRARDAALSVLATLSTDDYVQVVTFNGGATTVDCFGERLVRATAVNVARLGDFVRSEMAGVAGGTNFEAGFARAFDLLEGTAAEGGGSGCNRVVLFLTDGQADDPTPLVRQRNRDAELGARVFSFTLGANADATAAHNVACGTDGAYRHIADGENLIDAMATYYVFYAYGIVDAEPVWTSPYMDASGLGLMVTGAAPVYVDTRLVGVVGLDITVAEIVNEIGGANGQLGPESYAFLVSSDGDAVYHPRLARPDALSVDEVAHFEDIDTLEGAEFAASAARDNLVSGRSAHTWVEGVRRFVPRGDSLYEGLAAVERNVLYLARPVDGTPYRVGYAAESELRPSDAEAAVRVRRLRETGVTLPPACGTPAAVDDRCRELPELYHELELIDRLGRLAPDSLLGNWSRDAAASLTAPSFPMHPSTFLAPNASVFKLAPDVWLSPRAYLATAETSEELESLYSLLNLDRPRSPLPGGGFADDARVGHSSQDVLHGVHMTSAATALWREAVRDYGADDSTVWRYVATRTGVHRLFPGAAIDRAYAPSARPWYSRALSNQGLFALSTPYVDAFGAGVVVTLSTTVVDSGSPRAGTVAAVSGADMLYVQFEDLVFGAAPQCGADALTRCYLVDSSGMMVTDPHFRGETSNARLENVFMGSGDNVALRTVAQDLIAAKGVLQRHVFTSYETYSESVSYQMSETAAYPVTGRVRAGDYVLEPVPDTNLYLLAVNNFNPSAACGAAACAEADRLPGCDRLPDGSCERVELDACELNQTRPRMLKACPVVSLTEQELEDLREAEGERRCDPSSGGGDDGGSGGSEDESSAGSSVGAAVGGTVAALVLLGVALAVCLRCRQKKAAPAARRQASLRQLEGELTHVREVEARARYNAEYALNPSAPPAAAPPAYATYGYGGAPSAAPPPAYAPY